MALTHEEILELIGDRLDPEFVIELLEVTSEQLAIRLADIIEAPRVHRVFEKMFEEEMGR